MFCSHAGTNFFANKSGFQVELLCGIDFADVEEVERVLLVVVVRD